MHVCARIATHARSLFLVARTLGLILKASHHMLIGLEEREGGEKEIRSEGREEEGEKNNSGNQVIARLFVH